MKNVRFLTVLLLAVFLLAACGKTESPAEYTQAVLPEPDRIVASNYSVTLSYEKGDDGYIKLYEALGANWWKTAEGDPETASDEDLSMADSVLALKTSSTEVYMKSGEVYVKFFYEDQPFLWTTADGETLEIAMLFFRIPQSSETDTNVKGSFVISETDTIMDTQGLYTLYYPSEMANGFWDFLVH